MVTTSWSENSPLQGIKFPRGGSSGVENGLNNLGWETWVYELGPLRGQAHSFHSSGWGWNLEPLGTEGPSWLGLGIENRFRFQNRILVVKLKFWFRLSIPMCFFFLFICEDRCDLAICNFSWQEMPLIRCGTGVFFWCLLLCCGPPGCKLLAETTTSLGITGGFGTPVCKWTWPQTTLVIYVGDHLCAVWVDEHMVAPEIY